MALVEKTEGGVMTLDKDRNQQDVLKELNLGGKIRELRLKNRMTLKDISEKSGFSTALLSQIENNIVSPPISTLWKIAQALNVKLTYFFQQTPKEKADYFVVRKGKGKPVFRHESRYSLSYYSLGYGKEGRRMDPYMIEFTGEEENEEPLGHEGEEFLYVIKGRMKLIYANTQIVLEEGDSIYHDPRIMHKVEAYPGTEVLAVFYIGNSQ